VKVLQTLIVTLDSAEPFGVNFKKCVIKRLEELEDVFE
jgi:hypothetical protein